MQRHPRAPQKRVRADRRQGLAVHDPQARLREDTHQPLATSSVEAEGRSVRLTPLDPRRNPPSYGARCPFLSVF